MRFGQVAALGRAVGRQLHAFRVKMRRFLRCSAPICLCCGEEKSGSTSLDGKAAGAAEIDILVTPRRQPVGHFLTTTIPRVSTEMSLHALAYNMKRAMQILGIAPLGAAISG